jgi:hypothetical protein
LTKRPLRLLRLLLFSPGRAPVFFLLPFDSMRGV